MKASVRMWWSSAIVWTVSCAAPPPAAAFDLRAAAEALLDQAAAGAFHDAHRGPADVADRVVVGTALGTVSADMAAESAFGAIDKRLRADFDHATGHHRYRGRTDEVERVFYADLDKADRLSAELQRFITRSASPRWTVIAKARQGSLYDSCRTGLYEAHAPDLKLNPPAEEHYLGFGPLIIGNDPRAAAIIERQMERLGRWRVARERALGRADGTMIALYTEAVLFARASYMQDAAVDAAIRRLAYFTPIVGDAKIREWTRGLTDPATKAPFQYSDGLFLRMRPGMPLQREPDTNPAPLPASP